MMPLQLLDSTRFDSAAVLKQLNAASRSLAELKGVIASIPHQEILINTLGIQEAKDSSEIENIVTTHDHLYREDAFPEASTRFTARGGLCLTRSCKASSRRLLRRWLDPNSVFGF